MNGLTKGIKQLQNEIADHLGIDPLPIKFEDMGQDDSRLYIKEQYVGINRKYNDDFEECVKCIAHEYRHIFQIFYSQLFDNDIARRKGLLSTQINSATMMQDGSDYIGQELEIDAFAFTKFYFEHYEGMKVVNRIDGLDDILDLYIEKNIRIM